MLCSLVSVSLTGQAGAFRHGDSSATLRLVDSLQRLLRAHAVAVVDANDLHVHKLFHKVPLFRSFGVKVMFLIQNLLLFVKLFIFMGVPCLFPARNLVWLTVSPEEALASGEGACQGDAGVTGRSWRYIGQRASGWVVKVLCSVERRQYT